jgi:hypothetical protein
MATAMLSAVSFNLALVIPASASAAPAVHGIDPNSGPAAGGTSVVIFGAGFSGATGVSFGPNPVRQFFVADDHRIFTQSAHGAAGTVDVTVTNASGVSAASAADHFTYVGPAPPAVNAIDPRQGSAAGGTSISVFGSGFSGATAVNFGSQSLPCASPGFAPSRATRLDAALSTSMAAAAQRTPGPRLGSGGGPGGAPCFINDDASLFFNSPAGTASTTVDISVVSPAGTSTLSAADRFTFASPSAPVVTAVGPNHGSAAGGTNVTIFGSGLSGATLVNFGSNSVGRCPGSAPLGPQVMTRLTRVGPRAARAVPFGGGGGGGPNCFFPSGSDTNMFLNTPAGATGTVHVTVVTPAGTSSPTPADQFAYDPIGVPAVYAVDASHGSAAGGTNVNIHGSGFTGATAVHFGSTSLPACSSGPGACFGVGDDADIFVTSPPGTAGTTVDVTVTTPTGTSPSGAAVTGDKFSFDTPTAPVLDAIDPAHGPAPGGTGVNLYGTGLARATSVRFGATTISPCPVAGPCFNGGSDNNILVNSPGQAATGVVQVTVTTPAGSSSINFTYDIPPVPAVTGASPTSGSTSGGTTVYVRGTGFSGATGVMFGSTPAPNFFVPFGSDGMIQATSPSGAPGAVDIRITTPGGTSPTNANDRFTYAAPSPVVPSVTGVGPGTAPAGASVYISGTGFATATAVTFGIGLPATSFSVVFGSDDLIQAMSPAGSGTVDVQVSTPAGTSTANPNDRYTYGTSPSGPNVYGVDPNHGTRYGRSNVNVFGVGFTGATAVTVGGTAVSPCAGSPGACFQVNNDSSLFLSTPAGTIGAADVRVTAGGLTSAVANSDIYNYQAPGTPVVNGVDPASGPTTGGNFGMTLFGSGFGGATSVMVGATSVPACPTSGGPCFNGFGDSQLFLTAPPGTAGTVHVTVTSPAGTSATTSADQFTYFVAPAPTVTRVTPNTGGSSGGTIVFVIGTDIGSFNPGGVSFGTTSTFGVFVSSAGVIGLFSPPGTASATPVDVTVNTPSGTSAISAADHYTYFQSPAPSITAVAPNTGFSAGGTTVFITGTNLGGATNVSFGGASSFNFFTPGPGGVIQVVNPPGTASTTPVDVTVTTPGGTSAPTSADHFTYTATPSPALSTISPMSGPAQGGTQVLITGTFIENATSVMFGANQAGGGGFSPAPNVIMVMSPPGTASTTPVDVTVTTPSGTTPVTPNDHFTYTAALAPIVSLISPASGPSATTVLISGSNFNGMTTVNFGGPTHSSPFAFPIGPGVIRANSPPAAASITPVDITVVGPGGTSSTSAADQYTYTAGASPSITIVAPNIGAAGTTVTITGTGLGGATSVSFGATAVTSLFVRSDTLIRVTSPAGSGTVDVRVTTVVGTTPITAGDIYSYPGALMVTGVSPNSGPSAGGTAVTLTGSGFTGATAVHFGPNSGTGLVVNSDTQLTVTSPPGSGVVDLTVTTSAGTSPTTLADQFNYGGLYSRVSNRQYTLANSDGNTWVDLDSATATPLVLTVTPAADSEAVISGNADLWTSNAGFNQDLGIYIQEANTTQFPGSIVAWKESGGFAGTFSPNAAYVQTVFPMTAGTTYHVKLRWKANKNAAGATIWAGAGPWPSGSGSFSPTGLSVKLVPAGAGPVNTAVDLNQLTLANSDGTTWADMDSTSATPLALTVAPGANSVAELTANADLFTSQAGFNQDIGIYVAEASTTQFPGHIVAWKESGGFAGTFSPNAAFVQTTFAMSAGTTYHVKLQWKANKNAPGATIWAGAGAWPSGSGKFSPSRLTALLVPATAATLTSAVDTRQLTQANSDGNTWKDIDSTSATPLTLTLAPASSCLATLTGNADLWTSQAGFNQDIGIYIQEANPAVFPGNVVAWKESGGFAGTFSPNAAAVQAVFPMTGGTTYHIKLQWKTNKNAPGATIWSGAGPWPSGSGTFSPSRLTVALSC